MLLVQIAAKEGVQEGVHNKAIEMVSLGAKEIRRIDSSMTIFWDQRYEKEVIIVEFHVDMIHEWYVRLAE